LVGAAVDYSRANSDKVAMQAAVDATALMLSKTATSLTSSQMSQNATRYFNSLFTRKDVANIVITPTYTTSGGSTLVVTGTGTVPTQIMKIAGYSSLTINVSSTVRWGNSRLRVALVLDNTGSMAMSNKMTALKSASHNLLSQLQNVAGQNGDVYVSIIPFANSVNVDGVNQSAYWIRWDVWNAVNGICSNSWYTTQSTCLAAGKTWNSNNHNTWVVA
jgi:Flp pilus assembly protein TadG